MLSALILITLLDVPDHLTTQHHRAIRLVEAGGSDERELGWPAHRASGHCRGNDADPVAVIAGPCTLFGLPAVFTTWSQPLKFVLVAGGALLAGYVQNFGRTVPIPGGLGFTGQPTPTDSQKT
jgi:hypothetical protein